MHPRVLSISFCLLAGLLSAAVGFAQPITLLRNGETFAYRVGWGLLDNAGELSIHASAESEQGAPVLKVTTSSKTRGVVRLLYAFDGEAQSVFDPRDGRLLSASASTQAGRHRTRASIVFDYVQAEAHYVDYLRPARTTGVPLPPGPPLDLITSLIQTRTWPLAPGRSYAAHVLFDDEFYTLQISVEREETISTPEGPRKAWLLIPHMLEKPKGMFRRGGEIRIWVSADAERLPLRFEVKLKVGTAFAELTRYTPPTAGL